MAKRFAFSLFSGKEAEIPCILEQNCRNSPNFGAKGRNSPYFGVKLQKFQIFQAKWQKFPLFWGKKMKSIIFG